MIKYHKKDLLVPIDSSYFIRKGANDKHNELTLVVVKYAFPVNAVLLGGAYALNPVAMQFISKAVSGFQGIQLQFNKNPQAPAFVFTIKAKTERRGDDVHNQELADKIVLCKANIKASTVARKILKGTIDYYKSAANTANAVINVFDDFIARETKYMSNM